MSIKNEIASRMIEVGGSLSVKSALNPILWLCAIIDGPCFFLFFFNPEPPGWIIVLAFLPIVVALFSFLFLLFCDRDKLQSEEYQLKKRSLEMIQEKGEIRPRLVSDDEIVDVESIENQAVEDINPQHPSNPLIQ